jgi:hypothetical protein
MIDTQYTCLELPGISTKEQLTDLLSVYAELILELPEVEEDSIFQYLQDDVEGQERQQAVDIATNKLLNYIKIEDITSQGASVVVQAHYEGDADNYDLCEAISKFLFPKSSKPYFLMRSAAADRAGAYSHQWVGYWKEGEVVVELTESYFDRLFASSADSDPQLGSNSLPVGLA